MTELGNVFDAVSRDGPKGPDLRVAVEVPRAALGRSLRAAVPLRLAHGGELVERAHDPEDPNHITIHLPPTFVPGTVLRLRGRGGVVEGQAAGDLFVALELVDRPARADELSDPGPAAAPPPLGSSGLTWVILALMAVVAAGLVLAFSG